ncbi:MAG TPA: S53 family peptidase [Candidatus Acidoferrales bacterium]
MASRVSHVPIHGSEYVPVAGAKVIALVDPHEEITVTIVVRARRPAPELHCDEALASLLPRDRQHLSREEFEERHGAHPDDLAQIESFARARGFEVVETSAARHSVRLRGKSGEFSKVFRVEMHQYDHERGRHRGINGPVQIPAELAGCVETVLGLHDRPVALRHMAAPATKKAERARFSPHDVADLYRFPKHATGKGQCIGVIELGGGYHRSDLENFFASLKMPMPKITDVSVDGTKNAPADFASLKNFVTALNSGKKSAIDAAERGKLGSRGSADLLLSTIETTMDVELVGAFAPGAEIVVYFASSSEQGVYHALTAALADKKHRPTVLSLSWGEQESSWSPKYMALIDNVLKNLSTVGVTVCVSSGDAGADNGSPDGKPSVNFPASSPNALGCGGTTLKVSGSEIEAEVVWNCVFDGMRGATGGGVSQMFARPFWQENFEVPHSSSKTGGRGVPDVAGVADPHTGCRIVVGGVDTVSYGTSAVAPLWAALVARLNHATGARLGSGHLNSLLYKVARQSKGNGTFRPITHGENGAYHAGPGWNACTGLGSPMGDRLLEALGGDKSS